MKNIKRCVSMAMIGLLIGFWAPQSITDARLSTTPLSTAGVEAIATGQAASPTLATSTAARIIYVNHAAVGANNGNSWQDAFTSLQAALDAAVSGDQIWAAQGIYRPSAGTGRAVTFQLKDGVTMYGGFGGWETHHNQRDWRNRLTVLSGDIDHNDQTDARGVVTSWEHIQGNNAYNVVTADTVGAIGTLDGFVITGGQANGSDQYRFGGGLRCGDYWIACESHTLRNLIFSGNHAIRDGGGMWMDTGTLHLENIIFKGNYATQGGGLSIWYGRPSLQNIVFQGNIADSFGGGLWNEGADTVLMNVLFSGNVACDGGGMDNHAAQPKLINVTFSGNRATRRGGGLSNAWPTSYITLVNSILWGNTAESGQQFASGGSTYAHIRNSLIQGSGGSGAAWDITLGVDGGNNRDADPRFVTPVDANAAPTTAGDYHLRPPSPAIEAGTNVSVTVTLDLDGKRRIAGDRVDMGAYEWQGAYTTLTPAAGGLLVYTDAPRQITTTINIPTGAVSETVSLVFSEHESPLFAGPGGMLATGPFFDLEAYQDTTLLPKFTFLQPATITVSYPDSMVNGLWEETLTLYYWDTAANTWRDVAQTCTPPGVYTRDLPGNSLAVPVCHLSHFALFGEGRYKICLPLVQR